MSCKVLLVIENTAIVEHVSDNVHANDSLGDPPAYRLCKVGYVTDLGEPQKMWDTGVTIGADSSSLFAFAEMVKATATIVRNRGSR